MAKVKIFKQCEDVFQNFLKSESYGVLLLNSPIKLANNKLWTIWNQAKIRVLVDGGAESWISWNKSPTKKCEILLPNLVTGDFDSVSPETLEKFKKNEEVQVIHTPDQDETDFTKALKECSKYQKKHDIKIENIYVLTETAGRLDHVMAGINTLFKAEKMFTDISVILMASDSISWLLMPGASTISIPKVLRDKHEWCGLIPIGSPAKVTSSGLKWNLKETICQFGDMVSTSNTYEGTPEVKVDTDSPLLWTMGTSDLMH